MQLILTAFAALGAVALASPAPAAPPASGEPAVEVMVLGTWHFANPGQDLVNVEAEDVRTPARQAELAALTKALADFKPTKIMVERVAQDAALNDPNYAGFTPAALTRDRDERVQIAYRLARELGHARVYAIDEQPAAGEPDYFPFGAVMSHAQSTGKGAALQAMLGVPAAEAKRFEAAQKTTTIPQLLIGKNDPAGFDSSIGGYYGLLGIGDTMAQPGADLNAMWYLRNAKIFAKLVTVATPGDRVLVVFGSGHNYWLRHFARETPGFASIDPQPYLAQAARAARER